VGTVASHDDTAGKVEREGHGVPAQGLGEGEGSR